MNKTKIDWADYSWNPIVGCDMGCKWCYARRFAERYKMVIDFFKPQFFPSRIQDPVSIKKPSIIFLGSMAGIFSKTVQSEWIDQIIGTINKCPQHTFMVLEKRPSGYNRFDWPKNCYIGTSIDLASTGTKRIEDLRNVQTNVKKFVSVEPICGFMHSIDLSFADLVIVGAMTGARPVIPPKGWVDSVKHENIFYKDNIIEYYGDLPHGSKQQIVK